MFSVQLICEGVIMENDRSLAWLSGHLLLMSLSLNIPLIIIDTPFWVNILATIVIFATAFSGNTLVAYIYRVIHNVLLRPGLYIWALLVTITGPQDIIAIGFYIATVIQFKNIVGNLIGEIAVLSSIWK